MPDLIEPCPWCGSDGVLHRSAAMAPGGHPWAMGVGCERCGACGPRSYHGEQVAVQDWNRVAALRAAREEMRERIAELEKVVPLDRFCEAYRVWESACREQWGGDSERVKAIAYVRLLITKSSLLDRLVYGKETLRTEKCPVHKGHWSGLPLRVEPCGCDLTGWLPADAAARAALKGEAK